MTEESIQCPYGANDCPKVQNLRKELESIHWKLNALIMVVIALHGAEIIAVLGAMK